jgi:hypothetical protein
MHIIRYGFSHLKYICDCSNIIHNIVRKNERISFSCSQFTNRDGIVIISIFIIIFRMFIATDSYRIRIINRYEHNTSRNRYVYIGRD